MTRKKREQRRQQRREMSTGAPRITFESLQNSQDDTATRYLGYYALLGAIRKYSEPPHEDIPVLPGISEDGRRIWGSAKGVEAAVNLVNIFAETLEIVDEAHAELLHAGLPLENIVASVTAQQKTIQALVRRLDVMTQLRD